MHLNHGCVSDLSRDPLPLRGRVALVTGAGRRQGIGCALGRRLAAWGASVFLHHHEQVEGADDVGAVVDEVRSHLVGGARVVEGGGDLAEPTGPDRLVSAAATELGHLDVLVCNHARNGSDGPLSEVDADLLDRHWAVNTRSTILLTRAFAAQHDGRGGGRVVLLTSGQAQGPMPGEVAYAASKGALAEVALTLADELADAGITVNAVNPGPVRTGHLDDEELRQLAPKFPFGRAGEPDDPARLISWLATDEAVWITGQVLHSEGGFARWR